MKRKNRDPCYFRYVSTDKPSESGIYYNFNELRVHKKFINNCGFWVHELTEATITQVLCDWGIEWRNSLKFKGFKPTSITHLISPFGENNGRNLNPQVTNRLPKW